MQPNSQAKGLFLQLDLMTSGLEWRNVTFTPIKNHNSILYNVYRHRSPSGFWISEDIIRNSKGKEGKIEES